MKEPARYYKQLHNIQTTYSESQEYGNDRLVKGWIHLFICFKECFYVFSENFIHMKM